MKVLFVGPQGSGKSTQARLLSEYLKVPFISTGDIFRQIADQDTPSATQVREVLASGKLVDDQSTSKIVQERLTQADCGNGFILDGYPRTTQQIRFFDPGFDMVFYLKLNDIDAKKRMLGRGRSDDTPELIDERLRVYHQLTDPIIEYYSNKGLVKEIDANQNIEGIQTEIRGLLNAQSK